MIESHIEKTPAPPLLQSKTQVPAIEQTPGGLYFKVGNRETACMFSDGKDVITIHLSNEDAAIIGEWLRKECGL